MSSAPGGSPFRCFSPPSAPTVSLPMLVFDDGPFVVRFTGRRGGGSPAPFAGLNVGDRVGDDPGRVALHRRWIVEAAGLAGCTLVTLRQVHGQRVIFHPAPGAVLDRPLSLLYPEADALIGRDADACLAVKTADCVGLLLWDEASGLFAAVHAGWRGALGGVVPAALAAFRAAGGGRAPGIRTAIGPAIGPCCYQVGAEVDERLAQGPASWQAHLIARGGERFLDLPGLVRTQLLEGGVAEGAIGAAGLCTACRSDDFYSHRRAGPTGRQLALIGRKANP